MIPWDLILEYYTEDSWSKALLNVTSFRLHPGTELGPGKYLISLALSWPGLMTHGPDPSPQGMGSSWWGREGNSSGPPYVPDGARQLLLVPPAGRQEGWGEHGKVTWLWGLGPKHRPSSRFSQDWATLSRFGVLGRTPAFWWTVQKYLKMAPRSQKAPFDDPFSPFTKFMLASACCRLSIGCCCCSRAAACVPPQWGRARCRKPLFAELGQ